MPLDDVELTDTIDQWRQKDNLTIDQVNDNTDNIGEITDLDTNTQASLVDAINEIKSDVTTLEAIAAGSGTDLTPLIIALG